MTSELMTINYTSPEVIKTLQATVAQGLTTPEFMLFVEHCKGTGLNPFKKEVWAIKGKGYQNNRGEWVEGKLQIMTGVNGFYAIANNHPLFDGLETGFVGVNGEYLPMTYPKQDYIGAWCKVYRKDRRIPIEAVAMLEEYDKSKTEAKYPDKGIWHTMKRIMIVKCAESLGLRKAFPQELNGMYTAEEMPHEYSQPTVVQEVKKPVPQATSDMKALLLNEPSGVLDADQPPASNKKYAPVDFTKFKHRYHLPVKKEGVDMDEVRAWMKKKGFKYNPEDKHWYGDLLVEKIQEYLRPLEQPQAMQDVPFDMDDVPEFDGPESNF